MITFTRTLLGGAAVALMAMASTPPLQAQTTDARWQAWLGCWRPEATPTVLRDIGDSVRTSAPASIVCVVPGSTSTSVQVVNFTNGRVASRAIIEPTGVRIPRTMDDCTGWELAEWSSDNRRVMQRSEFTCANGVERKETGVLAMSPQGDWLQIQNMKVEGNSAVYVGRMQPTGIALESIENGAIVERPVLNEEGRLISPVRIGCTGSETATPTDGGRRVVVRADFDCGGLRRVANAVFERNASGQWERVDKTLQPFTTQTARLAAGTAVSVDAVLEMVKHVDAAVLETWLADRGQHFELSGRELVQLADAGVPPRVIDILVALDNPGQLVLRPTTQAVAVDASRGDDRASTGGYAGGGSVGGSYIDPWLNPWDPYGYRWRYGMAYDMGYGLPYNSIFGYNYGSYGRRDYPYGLYPSGNGPIIIVPRSTINNARAVNGRGYTRTNPSGGSSGYVVPLPGLSSAGSSSGSSSTTKATTGSSGSGGSSSSSGRTAKTRGGK